MWCVITGGLLDYLICGLIFVFCALCFILGSWFVPACDWSLTRVCVKAIALITCWCVFWFE